MRHPASEGSDVGEDTNDRCDHRRCGGVASGCVLAVPFRDQYQNQGGPEHRRDHLFSGHKRVLLSAEDSVRRPGKHFPDDCGSFYHVRCCHRRQPPSLSFRLKRAIAWRHGSSSSSSSDVREVALCQDARRRFSDLHHLVCSQRRTGYHQTDGARFSSLS